MKKNMRKIMLTGALVASVTFFTACIGKPDNINAGSESGEESGSIVEAEPVLTEEAGSAGEGSLFVITDADRETFTNMLKESHTLMGTIIFDDGYYEYDVTGDGKPDLCTTICEGSGLVTECVSVFDVCNQKLYELDDRKSGTSYRIESVGEGGICVGRLAPHDKDYTYGRLTFQDDKIQFEETKEK